MKHALISPNEQAVAVTAWTKVGNTYQPVFTPIQDGVRLCEVAQEAFPVAEPLFWVDCADDVVADMYYYNTATQEILKTPDPAPYPVEQPSATGAQTL